MCRALRLVAITRVPPALSPAFFAAAALRSTDALTIYFRTYSRRVTYAVMAAIATPVTTSHGAT